MKRGRNQRRRQGGGANPNRALDSNGPDVRIRGTANQIYDKYLTLARDATSSGDRVKAENYLQHAEHYFRVIRSMQPAPTPMQHNQDEDDSEQPNAESDDNNNRRDRSNGDDRRADNRRNGASADEEQPTIEDKGDDSDGAVAAGDDEEEKRPRRRRAPRRTARKASDGDADAESDDAPAAAE